MVNDARPHTSLEHERELANVGLAWEETSAGLCVRFPAPPADTKNVGCAITVLVAGAFMMLCLVAAALWHAYDETTAGSLVVAAIALIVAFLAIRYLRANVRAERTPSPPPEPSILRVQGDTVVVERTGRDRDVDVSWQLDEIADIRLCPTYDRRIILGVHSLVRAVFSPPDDDRVRISVMHPSGEVDDVVVQAPGRDWIEGMERRLRSYLNVTQS